MAKVEKMFEELEKSDDDEPLPPVVNPVARGGAAGPSGRGEAGGKPAKADGGDDEDEEEPEVVEEPIQILVRGRRTTPDAALARRLCHRRAIDGGIDASVRFCVSPPSRTRACRSASARNVRRRSR